MAVTIPTMRKATGKITSNIAKMLVFSKRIFNIIHGHNSCPLWKLLPHDDFGKLKNFLFFTWLTGENDCIGVGWSIDKVHSVNDQNYLLWEFRHSFYVIIWCLPGQPIGTFIRAFVSALNEIPSTFLTTNSSQAWSITRFFLVQNFDVEHNSISLINSIKWLTDYNEISSFTVFYMKLFNSLSLWRLSYDEWIMVW